MFAVVAFGIVGFCTLLVNLGIALLLLDHVNDLVAFVLVINLISFPVHTVTFAIVAVGIALTTTVVVADAVQPFVVPITL